MGIAEDGLVSGDDQVAREREFEGPGEAESVHLRDDDGVEVLDESDDAASRKVEQVADRSAHEGSSAECLEVDSGTECSARTGENDDGNVPPTMQAGECVAEVVEHVDRDGVERRRAVQGDGRDGAVDFNEYGRLGCAHLDSSDMRS